MARLLTYPEHCEFACTLASGCTARITARFDDVLVFKLDHPTGDIFITGRFADALERCAEVRRESNG